MPVICHVGTTLLVVLDEANLKRVSSRDPLILDINAFVDGSGGRAVNRVLVTFGNAEDVAEIVRLATSGQPRAALRFACRGVTNQPEDQIGVIPLTTSSKGLVS